MNKTIVMFDMDGTLTEPRQSFNFKILEPSLLKLAELADIGIITGSDEDYLREQMESFLYNSSCRYQTHLMPCNGTKYLKPPKNAEDDFILTHEASMEEQLGQKDYRKLIHELILSQVHMSSYGIPLTGHFINCRGSLINWCPIGRNANEAEREMFKKLDKSDGIRKGVIDELNAMLEQCNLLPKIKIKFGGETSFDIYPKGWDKTYGLRHFQNWDIWFVGDKCHPEGNDHEIFEVCRQNNQGFETSGPEETSEIIDKILRKLRGRNE